MSDKIEPDWQGIPLTGDAIDHHIFDHECPACGTPLNGALGEGDPPVAGDVGVCLRCHEPHVFTDGGSRAPTPEEREILVADPAVQFAIDLTKEVSP